MNGSPCQSDALSRVEQRTALQIKTMLDRGEVALFDVRPEYERALASIQAAHAIDDPSGERHLLSLPRDTAIALVCHHGVRSQFVAEQLVSVGFETVYNMTGGIDAWSKTVDPAIPQY
jgi:monothiol glutaredoxin